MMKRFVLPSLLAAFTALSIRAEAAEKNFDVKIDGMTCANCATMIKEALAKIPGVDAKSLNVTLKKKEAVFTAQDDKAMNDQITKAIEGAGYKVKMINGQKMAIAPTLKTETTTN